MSSPNTREPAQAVSAPIDTFTIANDTLHSEQEWYEKVYQGDHQRQLTLRAVLMGAFLGMLMSMANLYTTLKVGWSFGVSITACVLSYTIWNLLRFVSGGRLGKMSILENNCMQSTASAAGYGTGATVATAFGALLLIEGHHRPWIVVAAFTFFAAMLGVFLAIPMKRQMINRDKLPFPTGIAAATTLRSLYSEGTEAVRKAYALVGSLAVGIVVGVLKAPEGAISRLDRVLNAIHIRLPDLLPAAGYAQINGKSLIGFGWEPSVLLIGAGMLIGVKVALSMLGGALLLYLFIGPWLISVDAANAAVEGYRISIPIVGGGTIYHLFRWAIWGGTGVMVFSCLTTLALQWRTIARAVSMLKSGGNANATAEEQRMKSIEVPTGWLLAGLIPASLGLLAVQFFAFQISPWLGLVAVGMSFLLSLVACRSTGETDTTPVTAMGMVMQLLFAGLSPGHTTHNLASAGVAGNSAAASGDFLTELKSGYMLGANPRKQFLSQFIGVFFGTLAIVPAWFLMVPNKAVLEAYNPPTTNVWRAAAEVLSGGGLDVLPASARIAMVIGALVGTAIPLLGSFLPKAQPYLPSAMGLGLSWVFAYSNSQAFAIGAVLVWIWTKLHKRSSEDYSVPVASGLIAGESLAAAIVAILATLLGLLHLQ